MHYDLSVFREAVADEILEWTFKGLIARDEPFKVYHKHDLDTASWTYGPPHYIYLGTSTFTADTPALGVQKGRAFLRHELCHYLWTERDMDVLGAMLEKSKIPFPLWNLFEDARIEHKYRATTGGIFDWLAFDKVELNAKSQAHELLFACVQHEGVPDWLDFFQPGTAAAKLVPDIEAYYKRICDAQSTQALMPIAEDWMKQFAASQPNPGDLSLMGVLISLPKDVRLEAFQQFLNGATALTSGKRDKLSADAPKLAKDSYGLAKDYAMLAKRSQFRLSPTKVASIAQHLEALLLQGRGDVPTTTRDVGKRLSMRHLPLGEVRYRGKIAGPVKRLELSLVFDCSGSMDGTPHEEGAHLVAGLNALAKKGLVSGQLILSRIESTAHYEVIPFPFEEGLPSKIPADGSGEGLEHTLVSNLALLKKSKNVFVYTDADITDEPIDQTHLAKHGIFPVGLYVSDGSTDDHHVNNMQQHFRQFIVRNSTESLVESLAQRKSFLNLKS